MTTLLAKALYDNVAETVDELSFRKGDIMVVLEPDTAGLQGWWLCSLHGRQGIVPGNRVRLLEAGISYQLASRRDSSTLSQPRSPPPPLRPSRGENGYQTQGKDSWGVYQVPPRCEGPLRGPQTSVEAQEVYQVPLARSCPKPLVQGGSPARTQNDYLVPDVIRTPKGKTKTLAEEENEVYVVPPGARLCLSPPPPTAIPPLQEEIYKVPRTLTCCDADHQEVYDHPPPLRDPLWALQSPSDVYDTPTSFGKKVARVAPQPIPSSCAEPEQIPEDIYDVPPAFQKLTEEVLEEEDDEEVYAAPSNLKRASALLNLYEVPEEVLCAEADCSVYDVPALALEEPASPPVALHRLSISSAGSSRSKSSVESGSGRDAAPLVKELVVDVVSALETLTRLHQSLQGLLVGFVGRNIQEVPDVEPLQEALKDFIGFAQVAVMGSTQASDPTLHQRLAKHLEVLEDALRNLPRSCGVLEASGGRRVKGPKTPVKGGEPSILLPTLTCQISESSASVAGLVQANANLLFQRPRLPSSESLSRRPLPALPTQLSAERLAAEAASPAFVRKGSIQDRPLPPPPPVFIASKAELGSNEYEGIKLTEEYDYVHLKGAERNASQASGTLPGGDGPQQNGPPVTAPESPPTSQEELSPGTSPELEGMIHDHLIKTTAGGLPPLDPSLEDLQLLHFYAGQCQGHYATLLTAIDSFFDSVRGNQPPKVFISHGKFVIVTAHKLVFIGDTLARLLASQELRVQVTTCGNALCQALKVVVLATKGAALQYPSIPAVQEMVDRVTELSGCALAFATLLSRLTV
ncbi:embryonal Fyn-associated substrate isoform X2 [Ambystoma mexicanum]|uniref:embryonal Fyn-associated substrate isoform X2 n=1 Tax=Ambystoma mexicanum TaxID=8296 RepID=UPI0037E941DD